MYEWIRLKSQNPQGQASRDTDNLQDPSGLVKLLQNEEQINSTIHCEKRTGLYMEVLLHIETEFIPQSHPSRRFGGKKRGGGVSGEGGGKIVSQDAFQNTSQLPLFQRTRHSSKLGDAQMPEHLADGDNGNLQI